MKHVKRHPSDCPACQANGVELFCKDIGRLSEDQAEARGRICSGSADRCGGYTSDIPPHRDGLCTRHFFTRGGWPYHHVGDKPDCPTCGSGRKKEEERRVMSGKIGVVGLLVKCSKCGRDVDVKRDPYTKVEKVEFIPSATLIRKEIYCVFCWDRVVSPP